jgi:hypothetical protein
MDELKDRLSIRDSDDERVLKYWVRHLPEGFFILHDSDNATAFDLVYCINVVMDILTRMQPNQKLSHEDGLRAVIARDFIYRVGLGFTTMIGKGEHIDPDKLRDALDLGALGIDIKPDKDY